MKTIFKISVIVGTLVVMLIIDIPVLPVHLVPDADAIFGVRRRAWRRGVVVGYSMGAASATAASSEQHAASSQQQAATAQQQSATAQQQSATAQQQSATAQQQAAAAPAPSGGGTLPLGTVVSSLPAGCVSTPYKDVEYYRCGDNYYRAMFQGNSLVYVTAKP
jgi:predicted lipid-binding transport protein (Tim44 family)